MWRSLDIPKSSKACLASTHSFERIERRRRPEADVADTIAHERAISRSLGGRTVFDDKKPREGQLDLF